MILTNNPEKLKAKLFEFKELLSYNQKTKIVLAHVGTDALGNMQAEGNVHVCRKLTPG